MTEATKSEGTWRDKMLAELDDKTQKIHLRRNILQLKYDGFKCCNDSLQIGVIVASTSLTLLEAVKAELQTPISNGSTAFSHFLSILPVFMSAGIATTASVLKFKKLQERMEAMIRAIDICVEVTLLLNKSHERMKHALTEEAMQAACKHYRTEVYSSYCKAQEAIERILTYEDLARHLPTFHAMRLNVQEAETNFANRTTDIHNQECRNEGWSCMWGCCGCPNI